MYYLILAVLTVIVMIVSVRSCMLRNQVFNTDNFHTIAAATGITTPKAAYSLGRTQLAFWTVIIVGSFIYVYLHTAPQNFLAPALADVNLTLLGIAAATTVVSKVIDNSQKDNPGASVPQQDYPSKGFFTDIISDENGVSIHRLQNVIWTIVVGAIYITYVAAKGLIPDDTVITSQLLILMGISSGAYLGVKTTENQSSATPANVNLAAPVAPVQPVNPAPVNNPAPVVAVNIAAPANPAPPAADNLPPG